MISISESVVEDAWPIAQQLHAEGRSEAVGIPEERPVYFVTLDRERLVAALAEVERDGIVFFIGLEAAE